MEKRMIEIKEEVTIGDLILEKGDKIKVLTEVNDQKIMNNLVSKLFAQGAQGADTLANLIINSMTDNSMPNTEFMTTFLRRIQNGFVGWK